MKFNWAMGLGLTLSLSLIACGGPDIDQVKADFENPSGSTKDKNSLMSANSQTDASGPVRALGASGVPGQSLTAKGKLRAFSEVNMLGRYAPTIERDYYRFAKNETRPLRSSQVAFDECDGSAAANQASEEIAQELAVDLLLGGGSASGDATFTMDLGTCTGGRVTGEVVVELEVEFSENYFAYKVTEELKNVCETDGDMACLDGTLILEGEATGDGNEMGELTFIVAWEVDGTWNENGQPRAASVKGGIRTKLGGDGTNAWGSIEYLVYFQNADGEEFSLVYQLNANWDGTSGSGSILIRGNDGMIECQVTETMVTCTGELNWTAEEEAILTADIYGG